MERKHLLNFGLQFITHATAAEDTIGQVRAVLSGGCRWVQLRMKTAPKEEVLRVARQVADLCRLHEATFIVDDYADICLEVDADGVHLGKNDMPMADARTMLGDKKIIGATCNTANDIKTASQTADYIGLGPFRFTTTKDKLAPVIGIDGYRQILWDVRSQGINIPIVAIGGIETADICPILEAGPNGVAISGCIVRADDQQAQTRQIVDIINRQQQGNE